MTERFFITGTDTNVGKTVASVALLQAARQEGLVTAGYKPVASGSEMTAEGLLNSDVLALKRNSSLVLPYNAINIYTFAESTAPHIVSVSKGIPIEFTKMTQGLRELESMAEWILVEGAGGWFTPLTYTRTFADWVVQEQLPVILVVSIKLGCVNHAMLTELAIVKSNLLLAGWIANNVIAPSSRHEEYLAILNRVLNAPFLGEIPKLVRGMEEEKIGQYLEFSLL